jgi:hypothetical protein
VVHKPIAGVSAMALATAPNVVRRSGVPPATYIRGNGGACQDLLLISPVLKRPCLPMRNEEMNHSRLYSPICGGWHEHVRADCVGALSPSAPVPGYAGEYSN